MRPEDVTGLGDPVFIARLPRRTVVWRMVGAALLLAAAATTPFLAAAQAADMTRDWYLGGGMLAFFGIGWGWLTWARARNAAAVFEQGVAWARGPKVRWARWEEIASVSAARTQNVAGAFIPANRYLIYYVRLRDGERVKFSADNTPQVERIGEAIVDAVLPRVLYEANEALARGEEVSFGAVTIGRDLGLRCRNTVYPWDEIGMVEKGEGIFHCRRVGARMRGTTVPISQIENSDALWRIVERELRVRREQTGGPA